MAAWITAPKQYMNAHYHHYDPHPRHYHTGKITAISLLEIRYISKRLAILGIMRGPNEGQYETPRTLQHYHIEGFKKGP